MIATKHCILPTQTESASALRAFAHSTLNSLACFGSIFTTAALLGLIISSRLIVQKDGVRQHYVYNKGRAGMQLPFETLLRGFTTFWERRFFLIRLLSSVFLGVKLMPLLLTFMRPTLTTTPTAGSIVARCFGAFTTILHTARVTAEYDRDALLRLHGMRTDARGANVSVCFSLDTKIWFSLFSWRARMHRLGPGIGDEWASGEISQEARKLSLEGGRLLGRKMRLRSSSLAKSRSHRDVP